MPARPPGRGDPPQLRERPLPNPGHSKTGSSSRPGPRPPVPRKSEGLARTVSKHSMRPTDMSMPELIDKIKQEGPLLSQAVQNGSSVTVLLTDFASFVEGVIDKSQTTSNDSSVQFRRCVAALRSNVGALRDPVIQKDTTKLIKIIDTAVTKTQQLSSHLQ